MTRINKLQSLCSDYKNIQDTIHGMMKFSQLAVNIIDTDIFQRLRNLRQLGVCFLVFPNASHTRFEHSLGAYHLSKRLLDNLITNSKQDELIEPLKNIPELKDYFIEVGKVELDCYIKELINIAALCHDLGHGPFSHTFDDIFIPSIIKEYPLIGDNKFHENRSTLLLKRIINNSVLKDLIQPQEIAFINNLINPDKTKHQGYIYQIVSNTLNGLDVDKYDYLTRDSHMIGINISFEPSRLVNNAKVINNIITFPKQLDSDIINLFTTRHYMHRKVYSHKAVISIDHMLKDLMLEYLKEVNIGEALINLETSNEFINLTDNDILIKAKYSANPNIKLILDNINRHNLYPVIYSTTLDIKENISNFLDNLINDKDDIIKNNKDKLLITQHNIGYVSGKTINPLDHIYLYSNKNDTLIKLIKFNITKLLPQIYQEKLLMIYYKGDKNVDIVKKLRKYFK